MCRLFHLKVLAIFLVLVLNFIEVEVEGKSISRTWMKCNTV